MSVPQKGVREVSEESSSAIAKLKKYLPDPVRRIEIYDFMMHEVTGAIESFQIVPTDFNSRRTPYEEYATRVTEYEQATSRLLDLLVVGAFHSTTSEHDRLWARCVDYLASREIRTNGAALLIDMQQYPTLLAIYAIGLGAAASDRLDSIASVLRSVRIRDSSWSRHVGVTAGTLGALNGDALKQAFPDLAQRKTPVSDHILDVLRSPIEAFVPSKVRLEDLFDEVEFLLGIVYAAHEGDGWGPVGRAAWRWTRLTASPSGLVTRHAESLIGAGLFTSKAHFEEVQQAYMGQLKRSTLRY